MAIDLRNVPQDKQTYAMCLASVQADGMQVKYVCEKYQTKEIYLEAVRQNGMVLSFVEDQTPAICLAAVNQD